MSPGSSSASTTGTWARWRRCTTGCVSSALAQSAPGQRVVGHRALAELSGTPSGPTGTSLLYVGCEGLYATGLYTLGDLAQPLPNWPLPFPSVTPRKVAGEWRTLLPLATYVVVEEKCGEPSIPPEFRPTGLVRAPFRSWRHFLRVRDTELPW